MVSVMLVKTMEKGNIEKKNAALKNFQDLKTSSRSETGLYSLGEKKLPYNLNTIPYSLVFLYFHGSLKNGLKESKYQFILYSLL